MENLTDNFAPCIQQKVTSFWFNSLREPGCFDHMLISSPKYHRIFIFLTLKLLLHHFETGKLVFYIDTHTFCGSCVHQVIDTMSLSI